MPTFCRASVNRNHGFCQSSICFVQRAAILFSICVSGHFTVVPASTFRTQRDAGYQTTARWATRDYRYTSSVTAMLKDLNWRPLDQRRIDSRLVMMYKVTYDLVAIPASVYLVRNTRTSRHIHPLAYRQIQTLKDYNRFTFFPRTIIHWNALPANIPTLPTLAQFSGAVCRVIHVSP